MTDYLNFRADLTEDVANIFDDFSYWASLFGQMLFRHLKLSPGITALDVGCGTGFPLLELADRLGPSSEVHGIDAWDHAVARARYKVEVRGHANVPVHLGDAAKMPYDDDTFDLIVSNLGVNNFENADAVMAECRRVCRTNGRLALTTNLVGHMDEFYRAYEQVLRDTDNAHLVDSLANQEGHRATTEGLDRLFANSGFEVTVRHTETFTLRYADGSALLRAYLTKIGFLDGWKGILPQADRKSVFAVLESRLNEMAKPKGLQLSIPAAYIEARPR